MRDRIRVLSEGVERTDASYVLYWAQANRRVDSNHALLHAVKTANRLNLPVLYYEELSCSEPYANDRFHTFLLEGVADTRRRLTQLGIGYVFYLRRTKRDPDDVFTRLSREAAAVVTDDFPVSPIREPAEAGIPSCAVDSSCIVPMSRMEKREYAAYTIRPKYRKLLPEYLRPAPEIQVSREYTGAIPEFDTKFEPERIPEIVADCEIDHSVKPSLTFRGGRNNALARMEDFLERNLGRYDSERNEPSAHATSGLSPYLHFGQISSLELALAARSYAEAHAVSADGFLEELIVRRELAFNFARFSPDPRSLASLPEWAGKTLRSHASDKRDPCYSRPEFEEARTHDALWNATQKEMLLRGKIHGYYRMYWGKKIIEWSSTCQDALETMLYIHDRYALDGRDPNTYTGILWCFGLHDRPWKRRPVLGSVRYMSLDGMKRKTNVGAYITEIEYLEQTGRDPLRVQ